MDSGTAAVLGALIGPLTTWFSDYWRHRRLDRTDDLRRDRLRRILSQSNRKWRKIDYLAEAIGATEEKTARLLSEIDARRSFTKGSTSWALRVRKSLKLFSIFCIADDRLNNAIEPCPGDRLTDHNRNRRLQAVERSTICGAIPD